MKTKIINYFFDEEEVELAEHYSKLLKIAAVCFVLGIIAMMI